MWEGIKALILLLLVIYIIMDFTYATFFCSSDELKSHTYISMMGKIAFLFFFAQLF